MTDEISQNNGNMAPGQAISIARMEIPVSPEIDSWPDTTWHRGFTVIGQPDQAIEAETAFTMVHNGSHLHVAVRATDPNPGRIAATPPQHARDLWSYDHVEFFLDAEGRGDFCIQIGLNGHGQSDGVFLRSTAMIEHADFGIEAVGKFDADGWQVVAAIPLSALHFGAAPEATWKINVARVRLRPDEAPELSTHAALDGPAFYEPSHFVAARAESLDTTAYQWGVRLLGAAQITPTANGFRIDQQVRVENLTGVTQRIEVRGRMADAAEESTLWTGSITSREPVDISMHAALPTEAFGLLLVTVHDADTDAILHQRTCDPEEESFAWKEHRVLVGDGAGGFTSRPAQCQFIPRHHGNPVIPYGLAEMDNGEIVLAGRTGTAHPICVLAFSPDGGTHWSDYLEPPLECGAPMMFTYLGGSELTFRSSWTRNGSLRFFSHDYGRTWPETVPMSASPESFDIACEGSPLVDHDAAGRVTLMGETGSAYCPDTEWIKLLGSVHFSRDRGRTWTDFKQPDAWTWADTYAGRTETRGTCEGAMVRAANGWLVAALRMVCAGRFDKYNYDNFCGTGVSISRDDGKTWSPLQRIAEAGRMHANLLRLPGGELVMTVIRRLDFRGGRLASYRRGCDAYISRDHGLTWDEKEMVIIDDWPHHDPDHWFGVACGHLCSTLLHDGSILTVYNKHEFGGIMIRWTL